MPWPRLGAVLLAGPLGAACAARDLGPASPPRRFALVAVDGAPVPAPLNASSVDTTIVLADTLLLYGDGRASEAGTWRHRYLGTPAADYPVAESFRYRLVGDSIMLFVPCGSGSTGGLCPHGLIGAFQGATGLTIRDDIGGPAPVRHYARADRADAP
jgi:hypothetical protein